MSKDRNPAKYSKKHEVLKEAEGSVMKEFYRKVLMLQEEEKKRISRDLHDETGQTVIALGASLNVIERELKEGNIDKALQLINEKRQLIKEIADEMKAMARNLRPPALDILGLPAVLREYFSQCTKTSPIKIEFNENVKDIKLSEDVEITLYRIVQEAIYNAIKHSGATAVKADLVFKEGELHLVISDNGKGFSYEEYKKDADANKMGLHGIKERVDILNGTFYIKTVPNEGTELQVVLPYGG